MTTFSIIVAVDQRFGIGKEGELPWRLPADLKHFKQITTAAPAGKQNVVIMGRKTWESLPANFKPLPERINFVISRQNLSLPQGVFLSSSLEEALNQANKIQNLHHIFVIGGGQIFEAAMKLPNCAALYLTKINRDFACDTFFPADLSGFALSGPPQSGAENNLSYQFLDFYRKK